jgi:hypothetical protein
MVVAKRPIAARRSNQKNQQFLAKPAGMLYCFSEEN